MQLSPWPVGQWGSLEILKLPRLLLRQWIALQKLIELLRTTPTQFIDQGELELVLKWIIHPYVLASLGQEGTCGLLKEKHGNQSSHKIFDQSQPV